MSGKDIRIVIGSNYGDEGKGATVNWLLNEIGKPSAVVRFNGGAQAGHTVVANGYRHVCSHYGAGVLDYFPTILTQDFVCSPHLFMRECKELAKKGVFRPEVYVSPNCQVATPWDMMLNQLVEKKRGDGRHGSVGVGFGETVERAGRGFPLTVADLYHPRFEDVINRIVFEYMPQRLKELGIDLAEVSEEEREFFGKNAAVVYDAFGAECSEFMKRITVMDELQAFDKFPNLVFEGAQGLALDQNAKDFPHVTRSNTGLKNAMAAVGAYRASLNDNVEVRAYYVTRPYITRHGAGPLKHEQETLEPYFDVVDETNKPHEFQGSLRFAFLDIDDVVARIRADWLPYEGVLKEANLVFTCMQQIGTDSKQVPVIADGKTFMVDGDQMMGVALDRMDGHWAIHSFSEQYYGFNQILGNRRRVQES